MSTFSELWPKFKKSKRYREEFVAQDAKQAIPFQIAALLKHFQLTQTELAKRANLTQGVVSRAADPSYGNLTINTLVRIAAGFDVAFVGRFVPFSELPKWFDRLHSDEPLTVASFEQEDAEYEAAQREMQAPAAKEEESRRVRHMDEFLLSQLRRGQRAGPQQAKKPKDQQHGIDFGAPSSSAFLRSDGTNESLSQGQR